MDAGPDGLKLVAANSKTDIAANDALMEASIAAGQLFANLLRVARGSGKPHEIVSHAANLVSACDRYFEIKKRYPGEEISRDLRELLWYHGGRSDDWGHGLNLMMRGAMQMSASRLLSQLTQERAGESELIDGLAIIEGIRAKNRSERR